MLDPDKGMKGNWNIFNLQATQYRERNKYIRQTESEKFLTVALLSKYSIGLTRKVEMLSAYLADQSRTTNAPLLVLFEFPHQTVNLTYG
jgi:hypothetical protein